MLTSFRAATQTFRTLSKLTRSPFTAYNRNFTATAAAMGVTKTILAEGSGAIPKAGDKVTIEYTGYLKDESKPENKGDKYVLP